MAVMRSFFVPAGTVCRSDPGCSETGEIMVAPSCFD
jgi:hypothetical protein